ncbi:hypothetical protein V8F20_012031 [Naviculisporaceae sp. PSN 640]
MSGLEPLVALGLACNIFQIVDTAKQSVAICRNILESGSVDPALSARAQDLTDICEELKNRQHGVTGAPCNPGQKELLARSQSTIDAATELRNMIDKLTGSSSKGRLLDAVKGTMKTAWRKSKLDKLEKNMLETQRILETGLLSRICSQNDALAIKQRKDFSTLGQKLCTFISNYEQGKTDMETLLREQFASLETHITTEADQTRIGISEITSKIEDLQLVVKDEDNEFCRRLLASLRYPSMNERRNQISKTHEGTFEWLFGLEPSFPDWGKESVRGLESKSEESRSVIMSKSKGQESGNDTVFVDWLKSPDQPLFWISGKPGAGKSTLMKFVLEDVRTRDYLNRAHPNTLLISHFIWSAGDPTQRSLKGLLCSLLHQLVSEIEDAPIFLLSLSKISKLKMKETPGDWSVEELKLALFSILKRSTAPVCILVDGLDEIQTTDGPFVLLDVVSQTHQIPGVKIIVSSRPEPAFTSRLKDEPSLRVQDLTRKGISRYCRDQLASVIKTNRSCAINSEDVGFLAGEISFRAEGVFLWASLALKSLERGIANSDSLSYLQERLKGLPDDLNALYKNMWDRLNEDQYLYREEAAKYLNMTLLSLDINECFGQSRDFAFDRFQLYGITQLLALNPHITNRILGGWNTMTEDETQSLHAKFAALLPAIAVRCAGLLELKTDKGVWRKHPLFSAIHFVHRSAKEFLCNTPHGQDILRHDRSSRQDRLKALLKADMATNILSTTLNSPLDKRRLGPRNYTALCCNPAFGLSLEERLDIMECVENYQIITTRDYDKIVITDHIGMLVASNCLEEALFALERTKSNRPLSASYLKYLLMLAIDDSSWVFERKCSRGHSKAAILSTIVSQGKVDLNSRAPVIRFRNQDYSSPDDDLNTRFSSEDSNDKIIKRLYLNSPLLNSFLTTSQYKFQFRGLPLSQRVHDIFHACDLLLTLNPNLEMRSLLILCSKSYAREIWGVSNAHSLKAFPPSEEYDDIVWLEADARFLLGLFLQQQVAKSEEAKSEEAKSEETVAFDEFPQYREVIAEKPAFVKVLGIRRAGERRVVVPKSQEECGFVNAFQDVRWVNEKMDNGRDWLFLFNPQWPTAKDSLTTFEHETREVTVDEFFEDLLKRELVVNLRKLISDGWPPPKYDPPEPEGVLEVMDE